MFLGYFEQHFIVIVTQLYGGMWQITPRSSSALQTSVLQILRKARLLGKDDPGDRQEIFQAMKVFSRRRGLPPMETFNGIAFRILRDMNSMDPSARGLIEIQ